MAKPPQASTDPPLDSTQEGLLAIPLIDAPPPSNADSAAGLDVVEELCLGACCRVSVGLALHRPQAATPKWRPPPLSHLITHPPTLYPWTEAMITVAEGGHPVSGCQSHTPLTQAPPPVLTRHTPRSPSLRFSMASG